MYSSPNLSKIILDQIIKNYSIVLNNTALLIQKKDFYTANKNNARNTIDPIDRYSVIAI